MLDRAQLHKRPRQHHARDDGAARRESGFVVASLSAMSWVGAPGGHTQTKADMFHWHMQAAESRFCHPAHAGKPTPGEWRAISRV